MVTSGITSILIFWFDKWYSNVTNLDYSGNVLQQILGWCLCLTDVYKNEFISALLIRLALIFCIFHAKYRRHSRSKSLDQEKEHRLMRPTSFAYVVSKTHIPTYIKKILYNYTRFNHGSICSLKKSNCLGLIFI